MYKTFFALLSLILFSCTNVSYNQLAGDIDVKVSADLDANITVGDKKDGSSLFPIIDEAEKGFEYIDELLKASFHDGINIGEDDYLESLVSQLGLDWPTISKDLNTKGWRKVLDDNLKDMYAGNCWGVPSFKITDSDGSNPFYVWGQDRMWLLKEEINKRLG